MLIMINTALAQQIADTVAPKIVQDTKDVKLPVESWKVIVKIIVDEVFSQLKNNAVIQINQVEVSPTNPQVVLSTATGPVIAGVVSPEASPITGKIT